MVNDALCPLCSEDRESTIHLLARCSFAQIMWRLSPLGINMNSIQGDSVFDWWDNLLERWKGMKENKNVWAAVGYIVWRIWKCRNNVVFNNKLWRPDAACTAAICEATDFLKSNEQLPRIGDSGHATIVGELVEWKKPLNGWVKINFDGGLDKHRKSSGLGIMIKDSCGHFRAARGLHYGYLMSPVVLEAMAA
ncbi:hypothetical protein RHMOL_Rhmol11G0245600 [Rhododendron molle]|uniref:Uncharacterized protein n=1 Tax=Rhododendron molle TaxID=49168 RepID=A0ACC0LXE9_RHOML|nr:hypothetical protein RHMOL_Rhmol11G0245600 [Rhododendron molle]